MKIKLSDIGEKILASSFLCPRVPSERSSARDKAVYKMAEALRGHDIEVEVNSFTYREVHELIEGMIFCAPERFGSIAHVIAIRRGTYQLQALAANRPDWEIGQEPVSMPA